MFPFSRATLWRILGLHGGRGGVAPEKCHPHALRHGGAGALLEDGASVEAVRLLLGHARPETTAKYLGMARGWVDGQAELGAL